MPRDVDEKKTRKALRKLRKAKERAEADGIELTDWEKEFVEGVDERLEKYGSAFSDPNLGGPDQALSNAQTQILRQLDKKSRGRDTSGFKSRKPLSSKKAKTGFKPRIRDLNEDMRDNPDSAEIGSVENDGGLSGPRLVNIVDTDADMPKPDKDKHSSSSKPNRIFRVIDGGKTD